MAGCVYQQVDASVPDTNVDEYSTSHVEFTALKSQGQSFAETFYYSQYHVRVAIDTKHTCTTTTVKRPLRTPARDNQATETTGSKAAMMGTLSGTFGGILRSSLTASGSRTRETSSSSTVKKYSSEITQTDEHGLVWWGFSVDDPNERKRGIEIRDGHLPSVDFEFLGDDDVPPPPPPSTHCVEVASYWSLSESRNQSWLRFGQVQKEPPYYNVCQIVAMEIPSDFSKRSEYIAMQNVGSNLPGADHQQVLRRGNVKVTPGVLIVGGSSSVSSFTVNSKSNSPTSSHSPELIQTLYQAIGNRRVC